MKEIKEFKPFSLSIYKLCEKENKISYFSQIKNRILRLIEEDESLGDFVEFNVNDPNDLYLDNDGMLIFSDTLMGYFEEKLIKDLWMELRNLNKYAQGEYELQCMFRSLNISDLLKLIKESEKWNPEEENLKTVRRSVIDRAREELKNRNIIDWGVAAGKTIIKNSLK